jgi:hypothetical protein
MRLRLRLHNVYTTIAGRHAVLHKGLLIGPKKQSAFTNDTVTRIANLGSSKRVHHHFREDTRVVAAHEFHLHVQLAARTIQVLTVSKGLYTKCTISFSTIRGKSQQQTCSQATSNAGKHTPNVRHNSRATRKDANERRGKENQDHKNHDCCLFRVRKGVSRKSEAKF